ncbi:hypothetical protein SBADM41S_03555 [Streptomyces badius]
MTITVSSDESEPSPAETHAQIQALLQRLHAHPRPTDDRMQALQLRRDKCRVAHQLLAIEMASRSFSSHRSRIMSARSTFTRAIS